MYSKETEIVIVSWTEWQRAKGVEAFARLSSHYVRRWFRFATKIPLVNGFINGRVHFGADTFSISMIF